ncbi:Mevalonate kinase protein [Marine Group I thaumarchaeote SCGC AAA799-D07]|nr:Mevalonate kinase protein [Marine Group I thaumarchaeote SCGC AAA799-D07]
MKSIASAPGKIILFGEHFVVHGTPAILAAIDRRVTVTSTFTNNKTIKINSELGTIEVPISSSHEEVKSEFRPFVYLANKIINSNQNVNGLEITINSDIPIGVGLGSSSACCVATAASISELFRELSSEEILNISIEAEKTIFPNTSGADCTVCTYGGMIKYEQFTGTKKIDNTFDLNLIIANSMIPHTTKTSVENVSKFKKNDEERFSQLCDLETKLIDEVVIAMKNNDATTLGLKMSENQKYLEEIQISNNTLRDMISSLNKISLGSKITGAGDGGCIIALVRDENIEKVPSLLGKDKECFSAKIDTKGVVWSKIEQ